MIDIKNMSKIYEMGNNKVYALNNINLNNKNAVSFLIPLPILYPIFNQYTSVLFIPVPHLPP